MQPVTAYRHGVLQLDPRYYEFQETWEKPFLERMIGLYKDAGARTNPPACNQTSEVSGNLRGLTLPCHMPQVLASVLLGCTKLLSQHPESYAINVKTTLRKGLRHDVVHTVA